MKILHVGEYVKGGVATYIRSLLEYQCSRIDIVAYLILSRNLSERNWPLPKENILYYKYERRLSSIVGAIFAIYTYINLIKPDIIHIHSTWAGVFVRILYFFKVKKPKIIYCAHGWSFLMDVSDIKKKVYLTIERVLANKTDIIVNISNYEHDMAIRYGLPKAKCTMIYNGVKECSFLYNNCSIPIEDNGKIKLLFVGRFDRQKGVDILLDMFNTYNYEHIELYLIGESVIDNKSINPPDNVTNLGWVDNEIIDNYYSKCDAVVIPSRWEGFGLVAIEAMKNKKAVIASNRGALPELISDNYNGYIFNLNNKEELHNILMGLNKTELETMGMNGYKLYEKCFTDIALNEHIMQLYKNLAVCNRT